MPTLPIFNESYRPSYQWTQELTAKNEAFKALEPLAPEVTGRLQRHLLREQVLHTLALSGIETSPRVVEALVDGSVSLDELSPVERPVAALANTARYLYRLLRDQRFKLTPDLLLELHTLAAEGTVENGGVYRKSEGKPLVAGHAPAAHEVLPRLVENALDWFSTEAFAELHPVEQAWLVHLRLLDLQPFERVGDRLARVIASAYTVRAGLPPVIVRAQDAALYNEALTYSFRMVTQPGVELFARSLIHYIDEMIALVRD